MFKRTAAKWEFNVSISRPRNLLAEDPRVQIGACRPPSQELSRGRPPGVRFEPNGLDWLNANPDGLWDGSISALSSTYWRALNPLDYRCCEKFAQNNTT
jgi:hypothetical protein